MTTSTMLSASSSNVSLFGPYHGMGVGDVLEGVLERHTGHRVRIVETDIVISTWLAGWEEDMRQ